jgi:hypothetical protein
MDRQGTIMYCCKGLHTNSTIIFDGGSYSSHQIGPDVVVFGLKRLLSSVFSPSFASFKML